MILEVEGRLRILTNTWLQQIASARAARAPFAKTAAICRNFFQGTCGFMWDPAFRQEFLGGLPAPKFKLTIAKGFELAAIVGPALMWDYPGRRVQQYPTVDWRIEAFGDPDDPATQQLFNQFMMDYKKERNRNATRCSLMQDYLNYSQREQPNGGLKSDGQQGILEALIMGRGCLWTEPYKFPGSDRNMVGSFYDSCLRLFIDPHCTKPNLSDCRWIARQHVDDYWEVERKFNLPPGSLRDRAVTPRSLNGDVSELNSVQDEYHNYPNGTGSAELDLKHKIVWYEIYSRCGVGTRLANFDSALHEAFETTIGDFARICVAVGVPYPLNFPPSMLRNDQIQDSDVRRALDWPIPYYGDNRWPVSFLDFYRSTSGPWPIAPLAMGIGELMFMNIFMSCLCTRVYTNSKNIWGVIKSAGAELRQKLESNEFNVVLEVNDNAHKSVEELISFIESPPVNYDAFRVLDYIAASFDKRVGLTDTMYGLNAGGKVARTAADINLKDEATSVRPDWMARCVEEWMTSAANNERICAGWTVKGQDLIAKYGPTGASLWDSLIANENPEVYIREMGMTVEANSVRKPNKNRDTENLARIAQYLIPEMSRIAQMTGNTEPLNKFIKSLGDAMDQDVSEWVLPSAPMQPPPGAPPSQPPGPEMMPEGMPPQEEMPPPPPDESQIPPEMMMEFM